MKSVFKVTIALMMIINLSNAQNSEIVIFTNIESAKFKAKLNGATRNNDFETSVNIKKLATKTYKLRIEFEDSKVKPIDKTVKVNPNTEYTFEVIQKSDAKQKMSKLGNKLARDITLRERDTSDIKDLYQLKTISVNPLRNAGVNNYSDNSGGETKQISGSSATSKRVTAVHTSTNSQVPTTRSSANLNLNTTGVNLNVNISDNNSATYQETVVTTNTTEHYVMPGYSGPVGCPWPMNDNDFANAKNSIAAKTFEDSKLTVAKQIANSNCLTSAQVRDLLYLFDFEDTKLDFAKYCYGYTFDLGNYYLVNDAFEFETSVDELNNYINSR